MSVRAVWAIERRSCKGCRLWKPVAFRKNYAVAKRTEAFMAGCQAGKYEFRTVVYGAREHFAPEFVGPFVISDRRASAEAGEVGK